MPSKTLIHLVSTSPRPSPAAVLERVRARRDRLREEETAWIERMDGLTLVRGSARFASPHEVDVAETPGTSRRLRGRSIVIATGSRPAAISIDGLPGERTLTNESLFDLEDAPRHLAIVGAGAVGCEMAFAFRRLGARVSVIQRSDRVLSDLEPEVGERILARMEREGIEVVLDGQPLRYVEASRTLVVRQAGREVPIDGVDRVLLAVGRRPELDLDLEKAGVAWTREGIVADAAGRTSVRHVRALGDVTGGAATTHAANAQGRRVVRGIALGWLPTGPAPVLPSAVFTHPEVAHVGPPLAELRTRYAPELIRTLRFDLADTDRGRTMDLEDGFVLVHALRLSGRVLSATIVAPAAGEMVPLLTLAVQRSVRLWTLSGMVFPYPTLSEAIKKVADAFVFETLPHLPRELAAYARLRWRRPRRGRTASSSLGGGAGGRSVAG